MAPRIGAPLSFLAAPVGTQRALSRDPPMEQNGEGGRGAGGDAFDNQGTGDS